MKSAREYQRDQGPPENFSMTSHRVVDLRIELLIEVIRLHVRASGFVFVEYCFRRLDTTMNLISAALPLLDSTTVLPTRYELRSA
jgi:hypothetical protein